MNIDIVTQETCQDACLERGNSCAGISCSGDTIYGYYYECSGICYLCPSPVMVEGSSGLGGTVFIKKPGSFKVISKVCLGFLIKIGSIYAFIIISSFL